MSVGADNAGITYTGIITPANNTYRLGGGGTLTLSNVGGNALTGAGNSLVVTNGGSVAVNGSNNYGGATTIQGVYVTTDQSRAATNNYAGSQGAFEPATLSVNALANGGAVTGSGIGSSSNVASNLVISGGTLQYTGTGSTTDHLFTMTPVGATLDASGAGAVDFTNTGAIAQVDQAPITGVTVTASGTGVPFNFISLPASSTNMLAIGMTVSDTLGAVPAGSTIVGVSSNGIYISNNVTSAGGDTLTFGAQNRTLTLTGSSTSQNTLSAALGDSLTGKVSLNKTGAGTWALAGNNTYSGGTNVTAGKLVIAPTTPVSSLTSALPKGAVTISGGTLQLATNVTLGSQSVSPAAPTSNVNLTSLSITGSGTLDIGNNHLIVDYTPGNDPIASIASWIASGYNTSGSSRWSGTGITSSAAAANSAYGIGYADAADPGNPAGLSSGQIEIMYTLLGDANLDGKVNGTDFAILATNFNQAVTAWDQGDFNYDGKANGSDFALLASNFNQGASQAATAALDAFAAANGLMADVPEPSTGVLAGVFLVGALGRRRRSRLC
jgi:fibronectin-binding autotransporter adhesin